MMSRTNILLINNHSSSPPPTVIVSDPLNFIPVLNSDVKLKSGVIYVYMYHLQQTMAILKLPDLLRKPPIWESVFFRVGTYVDQWC
jgi:hypothetical protein